MDIKSRIKDKLNENNMKDQGAKNLGLTHSSHNVWINHSTNKSFRWNGYYFIPIDSTEDSVSKNSSMDFVLSKRPEVEMMFSGGKYHVTHQKVSRGKTKILSIGKGSTPEEAWDQAKIFIHLTKDSDTKEDNSNSDLIDQLEKRKAERDWSRWGSIQKGQVEKFVEKLSFDPNDVGTRIKMKNAHKWDDLIDIVKKSKYKIVKNY